MNKQEAIWYVNHTFEVTKEELCNNGRFDEAKEFETAQNTAIKALQDDWIPVSERLPESESDYQVLVNVIAPDKAYHIIITNSLEVVEYAQKGWVTAWMPLPEPYKGGDTE